MHGAEARLGIYPQNSLYVYDYHLTIWQLSADIVNLFMTKSFTKESETERWNIIEVVLTDV